jgi:hypothetical protein
MCYRRQIQQTSRNPSSPCEHQAFGKAGTIVAREGGAQVYTIIASFEGKPIATNLVTRIWFAHVDG